MSTRTSDAQRDELERSIREVGADLASAFPSNARHPVRALDSRAMDLASADQELKAAHRQRRRCRDRARVGHRRSPTLADRPAARRASSSIARRGWTALSPDKALGFVGVLYGAFAILAGTKLIWLAWQLQSGDRAARRLFAFSIVYLFALFAVLLADKQLAGHFAHTSPRLFQG